MIPLDIAFEAGRHAAGIFSRKTALLSEHPPDEGVHALPSTTEDGSYDGLPRQGSDGDQAATTSLSGAGSGRQALPVSSDPVGLSPGSSRSLYSASPPLEHPLARDGITVSSNPYRQVSEADVPLVAAADTAPLAS
jgi:hypothetical protein